MKYFFIVLFFLSISMCGNSKIIKMKIPDKLVVLTFDDAIASHFSFVAPLLKQYGFGATFYVCEFPPNFNDSTKYMNWRQIKQLDRMGFEVANHTRDHPLLSHLNSVQISDQLEYIEQKCDSLKIMKPVTFAYPAYDLNQQVLRILTEKEYSFARVGGDRPYDPLADNPLLISSWSMKSTNKEQIYKAFKEAKGGKIVVLTIHGVPDVEHPWVNTSPELFKEYMQYLSDNHYKVISLRDLKKYINAREALEQISPSFDKVLRN
ncbi:polysaccharide deacetylase family protein [Sunxiuqinia sp. A32]|uniref:polysaccharide deacetylase family protein n=1 Tax=Sunxiuqinia sp. A32 TaxID=3461496 RepID=UPI004045F609